MKKFLDFYCFVPSLWLFILKLWCKCRVPSKRNKHKSILKVTDEKSRIRSRIRTKMSRIWIRNTGIRIQSGSVSGSFPMVHVPQPCYALYWTLSINKEQSSNTDPDIKKHWVWCLAGIDNGDAGQAEILYRDAVLDGSGGGGSGAEGRLQPPLRHLGGRHHGDRVGRASAAHVWPPSHAGPLPYV